MSSSSSTQTREHYGCTPECPRTLAYDDFCTTCPLSVRDFSITEHGMSYSNPLSTPESFCLQSHYESSCAHSELKWGYKRQQFFSDCDKWTQTDPQATHIPYFVKHSRQNLYEACHAFLDTMGDMKIKRQFYDSHLHDLIQLPNLTRRHLFDYDHELRPQAEIPTFSRLFKAKTDSNFCLRNFLADDLWLEVVKKFRRLHYPMFHSTVIDSAFMDFYKRPFSFDWKSENSFMKVLREQLVVDTIKYKLYWLYLEETHGIPFATYSSNDKIYAQIGVEVNVPQFDALVSTLNKLTETFAALVKPDVIDLMKARVTALITTIYNLIRWSSSQLSTQDFVVNVIGSLATLFPTQKIADCFSFIFRGVTAQSGIEISSVAAIKAVFVCIFLIVTSQLPGKHTLDGFIGRVKNIPQALKSLGSFYEMVDPVAKECILFVEEHVLKLDVSASRAKTIDEITKFSERVADLTEMHKRRQINKDPALAKEAGRLHYDAVRLLGRCINMNYDRKSIEFLRSLLPTTYKISESALASGADMNKIRRKPIVIWLAGQSQIGKTTLIMKLIQDIEKRSSNYFREHGELPDDWEKEIFTCCPENEYMDGYHGQNWVTMDEFNQIRDSVANPSAEYFILLRAISQFPYLLHMAALHEKPNSYMSSHGFILTSNTTNIQPESIKTKEAITNRISCPYRMEVREEYRLYFDNNRKYKLDVGKVLREFGGYTTDCYYFVEFDPFTEQDLPGFYTYEQVLWRMIDVYDRETTNFSEYSSFLDANRKQPLPPRDNDNVYTPPPSSLDTSSDEDKPKRKKRMAPPPPQPFSAPCTSSSSEDVPRQTDWLEEWKKPYTPHGKAHSSFPKSPGMRLLPKYLRVVKGQSGDEEDWSDASSEDFDTRDYVPMPIWAFPYHLLHATLCAPFVAVEESCQRSERVARWVPNFVRRFTSQITDEFYLSMPGYTKVYNHSAIQTESLDKTVLALAQSSLFLSNEECERVARHVTSFKTWAKNRLQVMKETASFYLPGFMIAVVSATVTIGFGIWGYLKVKKQLNPRKDPNFRPLLEQAETCYLGGCNCEDCRNADEEEYLPKYLFWNVPCKCYVDFCEKQSLNDKQRFIMVSCQNTPPTHAYHPELRAQLADFANQCICKSCPMCNGEECLCKGLARARGVMIGEDDLVDRVGAYAVMQKRLLEYNERQTQSSGPSSRVSPKTIIRTQTSGPATKPETKMVIRTQTSGPSTKTNPKPVIRTQGISGPTNKPGQQTVVRTQVEGVEHSHSCKSCGRDYTHIHRLGDNGVNHRQYDYQCPYEDCKDFHKGHHNAQKLQFEAISCKHGNECFCPDALNSAVEELMKEDQFKDVRRDQLPEFVRYDEASQTTRNCWDEFEGLTYVQAKRRVAELKAKLGLQSCRSNDQQAYDIIQNRLWPNLLRLYVVKPDENPDTIFRQLGHMLALGGNLFLTNYHFMMVLNLYPDYDVVIRQGIIVWKRMKASEFVRQYYRLNGKDAVVLKLDYKGNAFAKLTQHFLSKKRSFSHETQTLSVTRYSMNKSCQMYPNPATTNGARLMTSLISINVGDSRIKEQLVQPISWEYEVHTLPGDCGSPLVLLNSRVPEKIVGIHNAYSESAGVAFGVPVYQEDVVQAVEHFGLDCQYGWKDLLPVEDTSFLQFSDGDNFRVVSVIRGSLPQPTKSKLRHSPIFERLTPTKTKPGYLRPFLNEKEEEINPTLLSRKKWGYHLPTLDQTKVEMCDNYLSQLLCKETRKDCLEYRIPMTTEQAIIGIAGIEGMPSMNKQSSPGYPFIFTKPPGKGKTGYFGQYEWRLDTPEAKVIIGAISDMEREILEGNRPFVVSIDTLKDARIPITKADQGKTRIFSAEPVDYCALHRKYFLPFIAHTMINRLDNSCAPGINAASPEFDRLAKLLRSKGPKVVAADYAQFDGRIPTEAIRSFYRAAVDWYMQNWDLIVEHKRNIVSGRELNREEFALFISRIAFECINHVHVCEKQNELGDRFLVFYLVMNGQPSGNPGTAASNTGAGIWIIAYCYLTEVTPKTNKYLDSFDEDIYVCTYGDDMVMNISDSIAEIFNQNILTTAMMSNFMLECTDEQKTGDTPPPYRSLSEISFLKRSFVWNDDISMYVGVLPVDLLYDITNWYRSGVQDPFVITVDNLKSDRKSTRLNSSHSRASRMPSSA